MPDPDEHNLPDGEKKALDAINQAQDALEKARQDYQRAIFDYGYEVGWNSGFDSGWDAAFDRLKREEAEMRAAIKIERPRTPVAPPTQLPLLQVPHHGRAAMTAANMVFDYIKDNPGQRGVDIAKYFGEIMSPSIPERTIRTALHRLKLIAGKIKNVGGKWYTVDYEVKRY